MDADGSALAHRNFNYSPLDLRGYEYTRDANAAAISEHRTSYDVRIFDVEVSRKLTLSGHDGLQGQRLSVGGVDELEGFVAQRPVGAEGRRLPVLFDFRALDAQQQRTIQTETRRKTVHLEEQNENSRNSRHSL